MLEDMRQAGVINWVRLEINREYIVRVISRNMQIFRSGFVMFQLHCCQVELWNAFRPLNCEAIDLAARFERCAQGGGGRRISFEWVKEWASRAADPARSAKAMVCEGANVGDMRQHARTNTGKSKVLVEDLLDQPSNVRCDSESLHDNFGCTVG